MAKKYDVLIKVETIIPSMCSSIRRNLIIGDALELRYTKEIDYVFVNCEAIVSKG